MHWMIYTSNLSNRLSAVNCRIMKHAAVNYREKLKTSAVNCRGNLKSVFFFDKNHKLSLIIFIDFECFNHYFVRFKQLQYYKYGFCQKKNRFEVSSAVNF